MASKGKKLTAAAELFEQDLGGSIRQVALNKIKPNTEQPRKDAEANIEGLAISLKDDGLLQPIVVTKDGAIYKIIAGERRYRAATSLGWKEIECRILNKNEKDTYRLAVIENIQRENLNAFDESNAFLKLKSKFQYTDTQLSKILGKSRNYISEILSISELSTENRKLAVEEGINSKNMLIQLALAEKKGIATSFLEAFKNKGITSVRAAKAFNKQEATTEKKDVDPLHHVLLYNEGDFSIQIEDNALHLQFDNFSAQTSDETLKLLKRKISKIILNTPKK